MSSLSPLRAQRADPRTIGMSSPGYLHGQASVPALVESRGQKPEVRSSRAVNEAIPPFWHYRSSTDGRDEG